jgi:hypothetical protein
VTIWAELEQIIARNVAEILEHKVGNAKMETAPAGRHIRSVLTSPPA